MELIGHRNRAKHLANCLRTLCKGRTPAPKRPRLLHDIGAATTNLRKFLLAASADPGVLTEAVSSYKLPLPRVEELVSMLDSALDTPARAAMALDLFADRLGKLRNAHAVAFQAVLKL